VPAFALFIGFSKPRGGKEETGREGKGGRRRVAFLISCFSFVFASTFGFNRPGLKVKADEKGERKGYLRGGKRMEGGREKKDGRGKDNR